MDFYKDKKILIIGGTGAIGQRLAEKLLKMEPSVIRILSRDEFKQYMMEQKFQKYIKKMRFLIGDVRDYERIERASKDIDIVFHLAAMKHVPACEYNPFEAVQTNVIGMQNVIKAASKNGVSKVIFSSSDKSISPTNAMGATKLLAERLIQAADYSQGAGTVYSAVRFGNVMGTRGSVIPLFKKQILEDKEITVTDPTMSRFMMSVDHAVELVLRTGIEAKGGEIRVFKMPVIRLKDLYEVMIEGLAKTYNFEIDDIQIKINGLRAGEKMYEELMTIEEARYAYDAGGYFIIPSIFSKDKKWDYNKAKISSYSSHEEEPISKEEVKEILENQKLL